MSETLQPSPHLVPRRPWAEAYWSYSAVKETEIEGLVGWNRNTAHAGFSTHLHKMSQMAVLAEVQGNQLVSRCRLWLTRDPELHKFAFYSSGWPRTHNNLSSSAFQALRLLKIILGFIVSSRLPWPT